MSLRRRWAQVVPMMILWLIVSIFFWGWIFGFLTDTVPARKLVLYVETAVTGEDGIALALEEDTGPGIRMVRVHPFTYAMMDGTELFSADLYIVTASGMEQYADWFCPLPETLAQGDAICAPEGTPVGVRVWEARTGLGIAADRISYPAEEDCYLCLGSKSLHNMANPGALDDEATAAALRLLSWPRISRP